MTRSLTLTNTPRTSPSTDPLPEVERIPWSVLGPHFLHEWGYPTRGGKRARQAEHVEVLGSTGSGKSKWISTMVAERARLRGSHVVVIATKPDDETLRDQGWPVIDTWPPSYGQHQVIYWPKAKGLTRAALARQKAKVLELLQRLWKPRSNIIVVFDEIAYISDDLGLRVEVVRYYREARALGITVVASTQRPQGVPRYMHSESRWTVCFAPKDDDDAERMAQVLGGKRAYMPILKQLDGTKYEFLIVNNLTKQMYISWLDKPTRRKEHSHPNRAQRAIESGAKTRGNETGQ